MIRSKIREIVFQQLYQGEFYPNTEKEKQSELLLSDSGLLQETEVIKADSLTEEEAADLKQRWEMIYSRLDELDADINKVAEGWKTGRMAKVDLSLIRLAYYEMKYDDEVPLKVAINEAVEFAKKYGGEDSPAFVNAILGKLAKELEK